MSMDKTLRLTQQSGSQIMSLLDSKIRVTLNMCESGAQYLGLPKLSNSHSLKSLSNQQIKLTQLQYQNKMLKNEIANLKKQMKLQKEEKAQEIYYLQQQILKLKNLIQKGYYSIKALQRQNQGLKSQHFVIKQKYNKATERVPFLEQKIAEMIEYVQNVKKDHETEVGMIWQRVSHLQRNLEAVVKLIEQDRNQDKLYRSQLRGSRYETSDSRSSRYN